MWRRIYRQRRRLALGVVLFMVVGLMVMPVRDPHGLLVALVYLPAAMTAVFVLVVAVRPGWGVIVEMLAATILLFEVLFRSSPLLEQGLAQAGLPIRLALFLAIYYLLLQLGESLNRFRWPGVLALRAERVIERPPAELWRALQLDPGAAGATGAVGEASALPSADPLGHAPPGTTERVLSSTPGRYRHVLRQTPDPERPDAPVTADERVTLAEHPRGTAVQLVRVWRNLPLLTAMGHWLEDRTGDVLDDLAAIAEGRPNWSSSARRRRRAWRRLAQRGVTKPTAS